MNSMNMTLVVARKEITNIIRNKGLLFGGLWLGAMFGVLNVSTKWASFFLKQRSLFRSIIGRDISWLFVFVVCFPT